MKQDVVNLKNESVGSVNLKKDIFGLELRTDILARVVNWQLAKRRAGSHKTKTISEITGTTAKPWRQKGTGRARAGNKKAPHWRSGGVAFGPVVRDHGYSLPKKVRRLGLKTALASKKQEGKLVVLDEAKLSSPKTKELKDALKSMNVESALLICGEEVDQNLALATRNIVGVDVLPSQGANVYDILRRDTLVLTKEAVKLLEARLK
jgi:large subunit ribosomal protein L4